MMTSRALKRAESDERILKAAAKVFGHLGYSQTTLTGIAAEANVSQGLVSQRFGSKENLLHEVFNQTQILSFYDDGSALLPDAFYVLLEHLKREVVEQPDWFRFLSMIHTGSDTPESFEKSTKEMFESTPLYAAIVEAQKQEDLPAGDPWDIFRVFFRTATSLIGWYHEFGLTMPENDYFLYAIQYNRRQKEAEAKLESQKYEICTLQTDRDILLSAISDMYPLIVFNNLTQNSYYMLEYDNFTTRLAKSEGSYDELIRVGASTIPGDVQREQFCRMFERENVIGAYRNGKKQLCLRHLQIGDDGVVRWIETRMLFEGCECGEILAIVLSKPIGDEMARIQRYGEALQEAELAASAKSRFLTNLSHEIRTPMNSIVGFTELIARHSDDAEKVRGYAEKMRAPEDELMGLLVQALDAANLSSYDKGNDGVNVIRLNINESWVGIFSNASKIAKHRGVELKCTVGTLRDDYVYTDEILFQRSVASLIVRVISESSSGDCIQVKLEQLDDDNYDDVLLRLEMHNENAGLVEYSKNLMNCVDDSLDVEGIMSDLVQLKEDISKLGGNVEFSSLDGSNAVACTFRFKRAE